MKRVRQRVSHGPFKQTVYGQNLSGITDPVFKHRGCAMSSTDGAFEYDTADRNCVVWQYEGG
jgi:hypothetical protein